MVSRSRGGWVTSTAEHAIAFAARWRGFRGRLHGVMDGVDGMHGGPWTSERTGGAAGVPYAKAELEGSAMEAVDSREVWHKHVREMWELCNEAARRKMCRKKKGGNEWIEKPGGEISMDFITQRVEIDDPITGYMVRTTAGNQLQGFVWYTTFTVWTFFFKWDSSATQAGLRRKDAKAGRKIDVDGSLARELEMQCRSGHPDEEGVVFPNIAEVAVAGALGCGSKLMQRILDDIRDKGVYNYVVVQATEGSIKFYERFGFRRVGAVARYNKRHAGDPREVIGYRHWLHADEKLHVTDRPSYMMAYKVVGDRKPQPKTEARAASAYSLRSLGRRAASFLFDNRTRLLSPTSFSRNKRLAQPQVPEVVPSPPLKRRRVHS